MDKAEGKSNNDLQVLLHGASITLLGRVVGSGTLMLIQVVLARTLGPATYGLYAIGWTTANILGNFGNLGLTRGVIKFASQNNVRQIVYQALMVSVVSAILITVMLFAFSDWVAVRAFKSEAIAEALALFAPISGGVVLMSVLAAISRIRMNMSVSVLIQDIIFPLVSFASIITLCVFFEHGLLGAMLGTAVGIATAIVFGFLAVKKTYIGRLSEIDLRNVINIPMIKFSLPVSLATTFTVYSSKIDRLLIGAILGEGEVGIYQAAAQSSIIFSIVMGTFNGVITPLIANLHSKGELKRLDKLYKVSTKWTFYMSIPIFLVFIIYPKLFLTSIFGIEYAVGFRVLAILSISQLINASTGVVGPLLIMTGHQKLWFSMSGIMLLFSVTMNMFVIPSFGIIGASVVSVATSLGLFGTGVFVVRRKVNIWPYQFNYLKGVVAAMITGVLLVAVKYYLPPSNFIQLALVGIASAASFVISLRALGLESEDVELLRGLTQKLKG
jgi:O-antigen/teichoic acid export membrane protein